MKLLRKITIFQKIIFIFLIVLLPLSSLSLITNLTNGNLLKQKIKNMMHIKVKSYSQMFDAEINYIVKLKQHYLFDDDLRNLSRLSDTLDPFERTAAINRLSKKLLLFKEASQLVESVSVYIPAIHKTISHAPFPQKSNSREQRAGGHADLGHAALMEPAIVVDGEQMRLLIPDSPYLGEAAICTFEIVLSMERIKETFLGMIDEGNMAFIFADARYAWKVTNMELQAADMQAIVALPQQADGVASANVRIGETSFFSVAQQSQSTQTSLMVVVPQSELFSLVKRNTYLLLVFSIISVLIIILFSSWIYHIIHKPLKVMVRGLRKVEKGDLDVYLQHHNDDEFQYLYEQYNMMISRLKVMIHEVYEQKIRSQQAELKQLQSQINPHFLYNTLFVLHRMAAAYGLDDVTRFTDSLGKYFLYLTRTGQDEVCLSEEWENAKSYTEIQHIRFSERIKVDWGTLPAAYEMLKMPRLVIQPLLENAYKYGLEKKSKGGLLRISVVRENESQLNIVIEDNGDRIDDERIAYLNQLLAGVVMDKETTGLINVNRRLQLFFASPSGLVLHRSELGGLKVVMIIPTNREAHHVPRTNS